MIDKKQAIEAMARAIQEHIDNAMTEFKKCADYERANYELRSTTIAKAALSACPYKQAYLDLMDKVIVLEDGAEPEDGDLVLLVTFVTSTVAGVPRGCSGFSRDYIKVQGNFRDMLDCFCSGDMEYESHKIIQRQGKPVIMEGE